MHGKSGYLQTTGNIIDIRDRGLDYPTDIRVQYQVSGITYEISESLKLVSKAIKIGFLPVGQKKVPALGNVGIGQEVSVCYDPENPNRAYIRDNTGILNS